MIEELKKFIEANKCNWNVLIKKNEKHHKLFLELTDDAVRYIENPNMKLRKTVLYAEITEPPKCPVCGEFIKDTKKNGLVFKSFCSDECKMSDLGKQTILNKRKKTMLDTYGVENASQSEEIKEKKKRTCLKNNGVEYPVQSKEIREKMKETNIKKYGVEHALQSEEVIEKMKNTNIKKYGVNYVFQSEEVSSKRRDTMIEKYGTEHALQSEEIKEKIKENNLKKYGVEHISQREEVKEQKKKTCLKNFGVEHPIQSEEIKEKIKDTCLKNYGVEYPAQSEEVRDKMKETCLKNYGVEHPIQSEEIKEKMKETCLERFGVKHPSQSEEIKEQKRKTCLKNFGVEHPIQSEEIKEKIKDACLKKYGVEYATQSEEIKEKIKETCLKNYGAEHSLQAEEIKEKSRETCLNKYGVEHATQSEDVKEKIKDTCLKKYGVEYATQSEEIKEKIKETCLKNYGVENPAQSEEVREKMKETCLKKYGSENYMQSPKIRIKNLKKLKKFMKGKNLKPLFADEEYIYSQINDELKYKCLTCNNEYSVINNTKENKGLYHYSFLCSCSKYRSKQEIEIAGFLESLNITFKNNDKSISNKFELDLYIPEHNLGIEHNGMYWHCEDKKSYSYHQDKYILFKEHNIDVIQIFENEWENKQDVVKSIIKRRLNKSDYIINSEATKLKEVPTLDYLNFLKENSIHFISNHTPTQILGLYYNDMLIQLVALNNSEILSFTTKIDYSISNGLHKLLSNLKQDLIIKIDLRYSTGQEFVDYGFTTTTTTEPNCLYTDLKDIYQTESLNTKKIHDCGNLILTYKA